MPLKGKKEDKEEGDESEGVTGRGVGGAGDLWEDTQSIARNQTRGTTLLFLYLPKKC